ncbi:RluA family pseudouridine synthase [Alkalibacter mobilis]|uniref:RluA family pseudouridine synthase n=1 Tax=Alkalibacter mobilis TaxID=2787712 RepID=UPI0018A0D020|nr:RluA family pseudouridine synthase [Alkalibacter mobilis]MBF7096909.1 RluA family pseudouridine synthase [Alkalibacter mobilis]
MKESNNVIMYVNESENKLIKDYLQGNKGFSSRLLKFIKREGKILLNGKKVNVIQEMKPGDILTVLMPTEKIDAEPSEYKIEVVYEDSDVLIVNKEANMVTHPTKGHQENNLANGVAKYFVDHDIDAKIRFVNRLDRDTTGLVIIAKSKFAHQHIQGQMKDDKVVKIYYAVVEGRTPEIEGKIDLPIGRLTEESIVREITDTGKNSVTYYKCLKSNGQNSLVELRLETGRTHQIRVHMKEIGNPLAGDSLYNPEGSNTKIRRQALHSGKVGFFQPRSGQWIEVECRLPDDMLLLVEDLGFNGV